MAGRQWTAEEIEQAVRMAGEGHGYAAIAQAVGRPANGVRCKLDELGVTIAPPTGVRLDGAGDVQVLTAVTGTIRTLDDALREARVDLSVWEVERWIANKWDQAAALKGRIVATELWQVKVWLRRKVRQPQRESLEALLEAIGRKKPPTLARRPCPRPSRHAPRRSLEIAVMDPHVGLRSFAPAAQGHWDVDRCEQAVLWAVDELVRLARPFGPFCEVILPFGNDYLHADGVHHATTAGTAQPEMDAWHNSYLRGETLAITMIERLRAIAPKVAIYQIPGNHDRQSAFTLGRVLAAWYRRDGDVAVDASPAPYKFHKAGVNLIGFEHGHSIAPIRLAAIMANECREWWSQTKYREFHLGDQHRRGRSNPAVMEEQGVAVEFLPSLVPGAEWFKIKGFSWQQRGAVAFVWDHATGPAARFTVSLDGYTGQPLGK